MPLECSTQRAKEIKSEAALKSTAVSDAANCSAPQDQIEGEAATEEPADA